MINQHATAAKLFFDCGHAELKPLDATVYRHVAVGGLCTACRNRDQEGHTCIDINNEATHQDCGACRTESLLADETYCTECKRPANTECVEQGHETTTTHCPHNGPQREVDYRGRILSCADCRNNEPPAPRAGERDIISLLDEARYAEDVNDRVRSAAQIIRQHATLVAQRDRALEALKGVAIMLNTELENYDDEPWAQRVRAAITTIEQEGGA